MNFLVIDTIGSRVTINLLLPHHLLHQSHSPSNSQRKIHNLNQSISQNLSQNQKQNQNRNQNQSRSSKIGIRVIRVNMNRKKNLKRKKKRSLSILRVAIIHGIMMKIVDLANNRRVSMIKTLWKTCKTDWKSSRRNLTSWRTGCIQWTI